jgi:hypothetical protein
MFDHLGRELDSRLLASSSSRYLRKLLITQPVKNYPIAVTSNMFFESFAGKQWLKLGIKNPATK